MSSPVKSLFKSFAHFWAVCFFTAEFGALLYKDAILLGVKKTWEQRSPDKRD